jgi:outer membrane protein
MRGRVGGRCAAWRAARDTFADRAKVNQLPAHGTSGKPVHMKNIPTAASLSVTLTVVFLSAGADPVAAQDAEAEPNAPDDQALVIPAEDLEWHLADPEPARAYCETQLKEARAANDKANIKLYTRMIERSDTIRRPEQIHLTLEEAIRLTLENNYKIETQRFNPAIERTKVVEAQAAFDAVFFSDITKSIADTPTGSELAASDTDYLSSSYGVRKLLPTGMQVSAAYEFTRTKTSFQFQTVNPEYFSDLLFEIRQPFLRGFGLDYNLSAIRVAKNSERISDLAFAREVRDRLGEVEERYWRLVEARRNVVITARLLADYEQIYDYLDARRDFDIMPVQIAATKANLETSKAEFFRVRAGLFNAEDQLIASMNADKVDLADGVEIIPDDFPHFRRLVVDRLAEVQTALENRREIKEQELRIANAKIAVGRAKIDELPRLDVLFQYKIDGLAGTLDKSFDEMSRHKYVDYVIGVQFELPIGNRGPRAAHLRANLQHAQALAGLKAAFEDIILDVNLAARGLSTAYEQIAPSYESAKARKREVESIVARAERKDLNTLNSELGARQSLASARRAMLNAIIEYNLAIANLERSKGTLLRYNNVHLAEETD